MTLKAKLMKLFDFNSHKRLFVYAKGYKKEIVVITFLKTLMALSSIATALVTKQLIDFAVQGQMTKSYLYVFELAILLLVELFLTNYISYRTVRATETIRNKTQMEVLESLYGKKWLSLNSYKTGDLLTRIYNDVTSLVTVFVNTIPSLIGLIIQLFLAFLMLCFYDATLAVLTFLVTPIAIFVSMMIGSKMKAIQHKIQTADGAKRSLINESLQNILIMKSFGFLDQNLKQVIELQNIHFNWVKRRNVLTIKSNLVMGFGYRIGFFAAIAFGALRLMQKGISFGTFTAFTQLVGQIQAPIMGLSSTLPQFISTLSSVERLDELLMLENDVAVSSHLMPLHSKPASISLENIKFHYSADHKVLEDINLELKHGEKISIMGPSGEGKTTLIHILMALLEPLSGKMTMAFEDGAVIPIDTNSRHFFSYVPQSNALFSGTIRSNFLLTEQVDQSIIDLAVFASCSKSFIDEMPFGIDTELGERGIGLSQGQAQRITIARALIHRTPFLIFDEATSSLDLETERELISNIKSYYPEVTLIAVTHRESIVEICDRVYYLREGVLHESKKV